MKLPSTYADPIKRFCAFVLERQSITEKRALGKSWPWTKDEILANYRFCCVRREDDKVTRWIRQNWRNTHAEDPDLWFAMCVARLFNLPGSLEDIGYPVPWDVVATLSILKRRRHDGKKCFNGAYIVSTNGVETAKVPYLVHTVLTPLWKARERLRPRRGDSLQTYHLMLGQMQGFGSFMTAQVIADLKYVSPLKDASDWWTFASSGPGSRRGLNYVLGRDRRAPWQEDEWRLALARLIADTKRELGHLNLHAQDVQNCLCEYSKWHRMFVEGKRPKQRYRYEP